MTELKKIEKRAVESLIKDARWDAIEEAKRIVIDRWKAEPNTGIDAYTELKNIHITQGRIEGLEQFFDILEKQAFD